MWENFCTALAPNVSLASHFLSHALFRPPYSASYMSTLDILDNDENEISALRKHAPIPLDMRCTLPSRVLSVMELRWRTLPAIPQLLLHPPIQSCFTYTAPCSKLLPPDLWIRAACNVISTGQVPKGAVSIHDWWRPDCHYPLWAPFFWREYANMLVEQDEWAA
jgi:hypothetical protein